MVLISDNPKDYDPRDQQYLTHFCCMKCKRHLILARNTHPGEDRVIKCKCGQEFPFYVPTECPPGFWSLIEVKKNQVSLLASSRGGTIQKWTNRWDHIESTPEEQVEDVIRSFEIEDKNPGVKKLVIDTVVCEVCNNIVPEKSIKRLDNLIRTAEGKIVPFKGVYLRICQSCLSELYDRLASEKPVEESKKVKKPSKKTVVTKHQALQNLLVRLYGDKEYPIEDGFEGDCVFATINGEEVSFRGVKLSDVYRGWYGDEGIKKKDTYKQDGWLFYRSEE